MSNEIISIIIIFSIAILLLAGMWLLYDQLNRKLDQVTHTLMISHRQDQTKDILQRKLQAYERLSLLLERIQYPNVIKRCYDPGMKARDLINRMKMDIAAEYEHNITQQIYVSQKLWEIILLTKEDSINTLNEIGRDMEDYQSDQVFIQALSDRLSQREYNPVETAQVAIRTEVQTFL